MPPRQLCVAAFACLVAGCAPDGPWRINAGSEQVVLGFIEPLRLGGPVGDGNHLENVAIDHDVIRVDVMNDRTGTLFSITLAPRESDPSSLIVTAAAGTPPAVVDAIRGALKRDHPPPSPWVRGQARAGALSQLGLRAWLLALMVIVLGLTACLAVRLPWNLPALAGLAALTAAAAALRFGVSPRTFLHEYYHIPASMIFMFEKPEGFIYGQTGPAIYFAANALLGTAEQAVFLVNALLATLTIPSVVLLDYGLFQRWPRALLSGGLVCLLPVHIRFSASEELWIPGILFACWSLAAWLYWLREDSILALAIAVVAASLAQQCRPELLTLPALHAGLFAVWRRPWFSWPALGAMTLLVVLDFPRIIAFFNQRALMPRPLLPGLAEIERSTLLFDRPTTPAALAVLALLGFVWAFRREPRLAGWLLAALVVYVAIPMLSFTNRPCIYRTQMFSLVLAAVAAAGAPLLLPRLWILPGLATALALMGGGLWVRRAFVTELLDQQQEYAFLEEATAKLPRDAQIIAPEMGGLTDLDVFPEFLLTRNHIKSRVHDLPALGQREPWPDPAPGLIYYQGMSCFFSGGPPAPSPMTKSCLGVRDHYNLRPIATTTLRTRGYSQLAYAAGPYEIGFFEVTGAR